MQVQLRVKKQITLGGHTRTYYPGDWVDVGNQTARLWLAAGDAQIPDYRKAGLIPPGAGVVVSGDLEAARGRFQELDLLPSENRPDLPFRLNLFWRDSVPLSLNLAMVGFSLLDTWQVVIPMWDYRTLAVHVGGDEERAYTDHVIKDLRVPLYHPGMVFIRRCDTGEALMRAWRDEHLAGGDDRLALLRALWKVKPLLLPLPFHWVDKNQQDGYA